MALALIAALASVPLLLVEGGSPADGETITQSAPVPTSTIDTVSQATPVTAPSPDLIARARTWQAARQATRASNNDRAMDLAALAQGRLPALENTTITTAVEGDEPVPTTTQAPAATAPPAPAAPTTIAPTTTAAPPPTTAAPTTTEAPTTTTPPEESDPTVEPTAEQWAALRQCESSGNYEAISPSGQYRGAYQFSQDTWDWVAGMDRTDLIGVDPAAAGPADQDAMALTLWRVRGTAPWPHCGHHLT